MRIDFLEARLKLKAAEPGAQPTFLIMAYNGGEIRPDSPKLDAPLVIDLATAKASEPITVLLDHEENKIVGQSTSVIVGPKSIEIQGIITGDATDGTDPAGKVVKHAKNGFQWQASIGGSPGRLERIEAGRSVFVNGQNFQGPLYISRGAIIYDVSILRKGADQTSSVRIAARPSLGKFDPLSQRRHKLRIGFHKALNGMCCAWANGDSGLAQHYDSVAEAYVIEIEKIKP
jgi:hypothetical protein